METLKWIIFLHKFPTSGLEACIFNLRKYFINSRNFRSDRYKKFILQLKVNLSCFQTRSLSEEIAMANKNISISKTEQFGDNSYSTIWYFDLIFPSSFYYMSEGRVAKPKKTAHVENFIVIDPRCLREKRRNGKKTSFFGIILRRRCLENPNSE